MRLINNHSVPACSNGLLPLLGFCNGCFIRLVRVIRSGDVQQPPQDKGKLLQGGDDDLCAINQRFGQLAGVFINRFHNALRMFDLVDGILKLFVEHTAVGNDHNAIEHLAVIRAVQARKSV